ncbi:cytochrome P450 [Streptomyces sp. NPDC057376]|uniref:cytochrome P450 n=1 Tax=unclassified Streptomyces TaxID=2593676 RepID=UPI0009391CC8|nr:cytochrome P450 [Streptomyces sp. CB02414]OKI86073.1 cytochrome [Streptomyces sp. CB02414]
MTSGAYTIRLPLTSDGPLDPPAPLKELRDRCPVATAVLPSGDTGAYLTRYEDVRQLLSDGRFSRPTAEDKAARIAPEGAGGVAAGGGSSLAIPLKGEGHQRWRRHLSKYFTAKRMRALHPRMTDTAHLLVDRMLEGRRPADLKAAFGFPLPVYVICDLLGAPAHDRDRFSHWSDSFLSVTRFTSQQTEAAHREFVSYMTDLVAEKRAEPGEDLLSVLIAESAAEVAGMSDDQLVATGMALLVAGHETTANMIVKMAAMLLSDRGRWERLLTDRSLTRTTVDEALRYDANLGNFGTRRYLHEDAEIAGQTLSAGTTVFCDMSSANRDERAFADPDDMDLGRSPNPHLTFGAGPHSCLGQSLARTELQVSLEVLLDRVPTLRLAVPEEELRKIDGLSVGGLSALPVDW